jgi:hypothetical protein
LASQTASDTGKRVLCFGEQLSHSSNTCVPVGVESVLISHSVITCPNCGTAKSEVMPTDACQFFYDCTGCGARLRLKPGDCCVFCSYGSVPCPPMQAERSAGGGGANACCR